MSADVYQTLSWMAKDPKELATMCAASGITDLEYISLTGSTIWNTFEATRMHTVLESLIYGFARLNHYVDVDLPAEYVGLVIAEFVHPSNQMTACHTFKRVYNREDLEAMHDVQQSPLKPINDLCSN